MKPLLIASAAANDEIEEEPSTIVLPEFDPLLLVKFVTAGVLSAGSAYLTYRQQQRCGALPGLPSATGDVLTADEVAKLLRLDRKTVYDYAGRGVIPCQRLGKRVLFSRAAVVQWLGGCSKGSSNGGSG